VIALANAHHNLSPFYVCSVQIEQIEQLNTLLLQDIDHNFARFHDVVNNKILPQVKRYGIVSEPTRAASEVSHGRYFVYINVLLILNLSS
jgi:DASH complex subunit ASK1